MIDYSGTRVLVTGAASGERHRTRSLTWEFAARDIRVDAVCRGRNLPLDRQRLGRTRHGPGDIGQS